MNPEVTTYLVDLPAARSETNNHLKQLIKDSLTTPVFQTIPLESITSSERCV